MKREYNYSKLRGRIIEKFETIGNFAVFLGKTNSQISLYLNGHCSFSQDAIVTWCKALEIDYREIGVYFFAIKVAK